MTAQIPDRLILDPGACPLPALSLYGVIVGDIDESRTWRGYAFKTKGSPSKMVRYTALWKGFVSTYRLTDGGRLVLETLSYPVSGAESEQVHEVLEGEFWLDLREDFFGSGLRVPFIAGRIQDDRSHWRHLGSKP